MSDGDVYKVEERTKLVHNQRLVVLKAGEQIPVEQAAEYGLIPKPKTARGKGSDKTES